MLFAKRSSFVIGSIWLVLLGSFSIVEAQAQVVRPEQLHLLEVSHPTFRQHQSRPEQSEDALRAQITPELVGKRVTVHMRIGATYRGVVLSVTPFSLRLKLRGMVRSLPLTGIVSAVPIPEPPDWIGYEQLRVGDRLICQTRDGVKRRGRFHSMSEEFLVLKVDKREVAIPRERVRILWSRGRGHRGRTALIGAAIGVGFIYLATEGATEAESGGAFAAGSLFFGGIGAGAGAAIGQSKNTVIYQSDIQPNPSIGGERQ